MQLSYRQIEDLLASLHGITPGNRVALKGRIKHFQRSGWPGTTNTGKGKAATYGFGEALGLALGFELLEIGLTPERATDVLRENWYNIRTATELALGLHEKLSTVTARRKGRSSHNDVMLYCDPTALQTLRQDTLLDSTEDEASETFFYDSAAEMGRKLLEHRRLGLRRLALINLSDLLGAMADAIGNHVAFRAAFDAWEDEMRERDREEYKAEYGVYPEDHEPLQSITPPSEA